MLSVPLSPLLSLVLSLAPNRPGYTGLSSTPLRPAKFPLAEGIAIFVGVMAWDLLVEGSSDLLKALLIAVPCTLAWYAIRCLRHGLGKWRR
jgi:hypothetical protein